MNAYYYLKRFGYKDTQYNRPFVKKNLTLSATDADARLSVVFVLPALVTGGAERVLINLMNGLNGKRFSASLITISNEGTLHDLINHDIPVYSLDHKHVGKSLLKLYSRLRTLKPDVVVSTMAHMNFAVLLLKPFFPKTRFVVREATRPTFLVKNRDGKANRLIKFLYRRLYPKADMVICPAQMIIDEFRDRLGVKTHNHTILLNPLDLDEVSYNEEEFRSAADKHHQEVRFICVGRLDYLKGYDRLIEVLPDLEMDRSWHLDILGEGAERACLEDLIEKNNLTDRVTLSGLVKKPWSCYAASDCMLLPSRCEGLPNVVLESLACGTKVIATKESGGIHEIAARAGPGAITIVDDMQAFIEAMKEIEPSSASRRKPSLLPGEFEKARVIRSFEQLLSSVL